MRACHVHTMQWLSKVLTYYLITYDLFLSRACQITASLESACNRNTYSFEGVTPRICWVTPDEMPRGTVSRGGQDKGHLPQLVPLRGDNMGIGCLSVEAHVKCGHYFG
jgi:hypothetical protein